jgi:hypothetical protein
MEGFENFHDYQGLQEEIDDQCESVMSAVMQHAIPGTMRSSIGRDGMYTGLVRPA